MRGACFLTIMLLLSGVLLTTTSVGAAPAGDSFVLRAGRILPVTAAGPWLIENGTIIVRAGKIVALGTDLEIPPDLPVIDEPDAVVIPGLVVAATDFGIPHRGDESIAAGYRIADAYDRFGNFALILRHGITTAHIHPGDHRLLSGQGAIVKLAGAPEGRLLNDSADLCIQLGDPADNPPRDLEYPFPASSDVAIEPAKVQRPGSRLSRIRALTEAFEAALAAGDDEPLDYHRDALARALKENLPLRLRADRAADLLGASKFLKDSERKGFLVGGAEAGKVFGTRLDDTGVPLVFRPRTPFMRAASDLGTSTEASDEYESLITAVNAGGPVAIGMHRSGSLGELRLSVIAAHGAGLEERHALEAVTRTAAEILGVADRVGSLAPGLDADLVVLSDHPLEVRTHIQRVYVNGRVAYDPRPTDAIVVRAGTIWINPAKQIHDGEILIEAGKIVDVGRSVPQPPHAKVIEAGPDAFVTPGFIDTRSHLDLAGDRSSASADIDLTKIIGIPDASHDRVTAAGITTTILSPYSGSSSGARLTAVKTQGRSRDQRVIKDITGISFVISSNIDPLKIKSALTSVLARGKKYLATWKKYEKDLADYLEKKKKGEKVEAKPEEKTEEVKEQKFDPVTGLWEGRIDGGPIPEPQIGKVALRLEGNQVEGRVIEPEPPMDHRIVMTLDGNKLSGVVEVDTGGMGQPKIEGTLTEPDTFKGTVSIAGIVVQVEGKRIEKTEVEFKVTRTRTRDRSGKPKPPKFDPALEPIKMLLEKKIPAIVQVSTPLRIKGILDLLIDEHKLNVILINADGARLHAQRLAEKKVGVILPTSLIRKLDNREFNPGDFLARRGVMIAFQSAAGDGGRNLRFNALYAVERGLAPDAALAALTTHAARMFMIEDRIGSLEPGKDADLVIFHGHPFRDGARIKRVIINGEEIR